MHSPSHLFRPFAPSDSHCFIPQNIRYTGSRFQTINPMAVIKEQCLAGISQRLSFFLHRRSFRPGIRPQPVSQKTPLSTPTHQHIVFGFSFYKIEPTPDGREAFFKNAHITILAIDLPRQSNTKTTPRRTATTNIGRSRIWYISIFSLHIAPIFHPFSIKSPQLIIIQTGTRSSQCVTTIPPTFTMRTIYNIITQTQVFKSP